MTDCNRRAFLAIAGAAALPWPAFAAAPRSSPIIVNALELPRPRSGTG